MPGPLPGSGTEIGSVVMGLTFQCEETDTKEVNI